VSDLQRIERLIEDLRAVAREITRLQAELVTLHAVLSHSLMNEAK
jgi:hypothetical protein